MNCRLCAEKSDQIVALKKKTEEQAERIARDLMTIEKLKERVKELEERKDK